MAEQTWTAPDPITAGATRVRKKPVHFTELQDAINAWETAYGIANTNWTDSPAVLIKIKTTAITEMQDELDTLLTAADNYCGGADDFSWTTPTVTSTVLPAHINELRDNMNIMQDAQCYLCDMCDGDDGCTLCDASCYEDACDTCNATCNVDACDQCDSSCYGYTGCTCNSSCNVDACSTCNTSCNNYVKGNCQLCDNTCYNDACDQCDSSCYGYVACTCNSTCNSDVVSCSLCDSSCYSNSCAVCDATCNADAGCDACDGTAYRYPWT